MIDLSHYDMIVDHAAIVNQHNYIGLKLTQGGSYADPTAARNYTTFRRLTPSALIVFYHFADSSTSASDQAAFFADKVRELVLSNDKRVAFCIDLEAPGINAQAFVDEFARLNIVTNSLVKHIIIYGSPSYLTAQSVHVGQNYLWTAEYAQKPQVQFYDMWQYTDKGKQPGVDTPVDFSIVSKKFSDAIGITRKIRDIETQWE